MVKDMAMAYIDVLKKKKVTTVQGRTFPSTPLCYA